VNPDFAPFVTTTSASTNPITFLENVIVTGIGLTLVVAGVVDVIETEGAALSNV
jgi:hypothetical protein